MRPFPSLIISAALALATIPSHAADFASIQRLYVG